MSSVDAQASLIRERLAQRRKRRQMGRILVFVFGLILLAGIVGYEYYTRSVGGGDPQESTNVLILGVEREEEAGLALQASAVLSLHPHSGKVTVISLPASTVLAGDVEPAADGQRPAEGEGPTRVKSPADDLDLLRDRYAAGGIAGVQAAVGELLGVPVQHHLQVDFAGFVQLVDLLQGLRVSVEMPVVYRDEEGNELFRLDPGEHELDGEAALLFLRYRGNDWLGEQPRAMRHREFIEAAARTLFRQLAVSDIPAYAELLAEHVATDLQTVQMARLAQLAWEAEPAALQVMLLPGSAVHGVWVPDEPAVADLAAEVFVHPDAAVTGSR